jgi:hypothetical protein
MKTLIIMLALPLIGFLASERLDEDNGFGTYKFGSAPSQYSDLTLEIDEGKTQLYSSVDNYVIVKNTKIEHVRVTFCQNKLSAIAIKTKQKTGTNLLEHLIEKYGAPKKVKEDYEWLGKKVQLVYEPIDGFDAEITFYSRDIYEHRK